MQQMLLCRPADMLAGAQLRVQTNGQSVTPDVSGSIDAVVDRLKKSQPRPNRL